MYYSKQSAAIITAVLLMAGISCTEEAAIRPLDAIPATQTIAYSNPENPQDALADAYREGYAYILDQSETLEGHLGDPAALEAEIEAMAMAVAEGEAPSPAFAEVMQAGDGLYGTTAYGNYSDLLDALGLEGDDRAAMDNLLGILYAADLSDEAGAQECIDEVLALEEAVLFSYSLHDPDGIARSFALARGGVSTVYWPWPDPIRSPLPQDIAAAATLGGLDNSPVASVTMAGAVLWQPE